MISGSRRELATAARAWPFEEARKLVARVEARRAAGVAVNEVLFETGYGPSGLPHIGTFGEVARTSWVRQARGAIACLEQHFIYRVARGAAPFDARNQLTCLLERPGAGGSRKLAA